MEIYDPKTRLHYKLNEENGRAVLCISGIRMQEGDPVETARTKTRLLKAKNGMSVLEICTGLGYCTYELINRGCKVTTIEKDENVIALARTLPHFKVVETRAQLVIADAFDKIEEIAIEGGKFDRVLHDPPRFSRAPLLYSSKFYEFVRSVLKKNGIMVHYVGNPYSRNRKRNFVGGVVKRLKEAGFKSIKRIGYNLVVK